MKAEQNLRGVSEKPCNIPRINWYTKAGTDAVVVDQNAKMFM